MIGVSHHLRERSVVMICVYYFIIKDHESHARYLDVRVKVHQGSFGVPTVNAECQLYFLIEHDEDSHSLFLKDKMRKMKFL